MNMNNKPKINIDDLFINTINDAINSLTSDIHIEPKEYHYQIRLRINGVLVNKLTLAKNKTIQIISQLKILANLDITEIRIPQDGKISYFCNNNNYNLRLSTCPTIYGEKLVIRILQNKQKLISLTKLGLNNNQLNILEHNISKKSGLILFTGPTGSGKTTSLYACINNLNYKTNNIISIEDPVEISFEGITQINVDNKINLTFANLLKSILRQDPDIIIIGEIRDIETAKIALSAAQTGHLVFATMHCNNANSAITRLLEMGLPKYLLISSISLIIFQKFKINTNILNKRQPTFELKNITI